MPATRTYQSRNLIVSLARQGVALDTIARALVVALEHVQDTVKRALETGELLTSPPVTIADRKSALFAELNSLRATLEHRDAVISDLRVVKSPIFEMMCQLTGWHNLTRSEALLLSVLAHHGRAPKERIYDAMYRDAFEPPLPKTIDRFVCMIRRKIPRDVTIDTLPCVGYEMKPASVARLKELAGIGAAPIAPSIVPSMTADAEAA